PAVAPRVSVAQPSFQGPADATVLGTRQAFDPDTYEWLQTVKAKNDPHNSFRVNHNIPPTRAA
ncbi:MAG TPA: BBE domain-containing protein, partial [Mycobacterium sp.]